MKRGRQAAQRARPQSRVTGWAPQTDRLHRQAHRKLASSRDVWNTTIQELEQPAGGLDTVGVGS